jgi:hypothetical protein
VRVCAEQQPSPEIRLREIAEAVSGELRKNLARRGVEWSDRFGPDVADAFYDLLSRGVIEAGPGAFT